MHAMMSFRSAVRVEPGAFVEVTEQQLSQIVRDLAPRLELATDAEADRLRLLSDRESTEFPSRESRRDTCWDKEARQRRKAFKFPTLESVTDRDWDLIFREASQYAVNVLIRHRKDATLADAIALNVVKSVRAGETKWSPSVNPNVLLYIFGIIRFSAPEMADEIDPPQAMHRSRRSRRNRGSGILKNIVSTMDVQDVIQHLPTIALMVGRLNDLLNPVKNPSEAVAG